MPRPLPVHKAVAGVMRDVEAVGKGQANEERGYRFRGIDDVVNEVGPALRKRGVLVLPEVVDLKVTNVDTRQGPGRSAVVRVRFRFVGPAGDELAVEVAGEAIDNGDKAVAKAQSVAFRVALLQALAIPTGDPDPDAATYNLHRTPAPSSRPATAEAETVPADLAAAAVLAAANGDADIAAAVLPEPRDLPASMLAGLKRAAARRARNAQTSTSGPQEPQEPAEAPAGPDHPSDDAEGAQEAAP